MSFANLIKDKKQANAALVQKYNFPKTNKAVGLVKIQDAKVLKKLLKWCAWLKTNFIVMTNDVFELESKNISYIAENWILSTGLDFVICDEATDCITQCFEQGIAPIIASTSNVSSLLSQFNPMRNEGNAYMYDSVNEWSIFATLIRYLENYKFAFDNKNLVKNIFES